MSPGCVSDNAIEVEIPGKVEVEYLELNAHALDTSPEQSCPLAHSWFNPEPFPEQPPPDGEQTSPADLPFDMAD